ncbi:hypothetical protein Hypma_004363 [Hypsizygus marmoreus]|uniref:F-box domain-containing protein n=1 Tax=Hypsizygus marmoreus TaxID=39966 RepID=A0A369K432_HYPMA|nr:hypothetical protein Hypma_004363 [Hypsizygus marmoreus]
MKFRPPDNLDGDVAPISSEASMDSLPVELLTSIFKHVYMQSRVRVGFGLRVWFDNSIEPDIDTTWKDEDLTDPLLFPKVLNAVCRRWRAISESLPIFWTRIAVFIDSTPTPLSKIQRYLELARDQPIHFLVLRRPGTYSDVDPGEKQRCRDVIEVLRPHIRQCHTITFDVINSSSLPSIAADFHGIASILEKLHLNCRVDDGVAPGLARSHSPPIDIEPFVSPAITRLSLDGRNFAYACLTYPSWTQSMRKSRVRLTLHTFTPTLAQDFTFTFYDFLRILSHLMPRHLSLSAIELYCDETAAVPQVETYISSYEFKDLSHDSFLDMMEFSSQYAENIRISRCPVGALHVDFACCYLTVDSIDQNEDLRLFLRGWQGSELRISNCPGFDDGALGILARADDVHIRSLDITNCSSFSPDQLQRLVTGLNRAVSKLHSEGLDDREEFALDWLSVMGHQQSLTPEQEHWFQQNVRAFRWNRWETHYHQQSSHIGD